MRFIQSMTHTTKVVLELDVRIDPEDLFPPCLWVHIFV